MQLSSLIDEYRACEAALSDAIKAERVAAIREYDIRMNWLRNVIRDHDAKTETDRLLQVDFFMDSISQAADLDHDSGLFSDVRAIVERYITRTADTTNTPHETDVSSGPDNGMPHGDIATMIDRTDLRVSTFDTDLRYIETSPANARYHEMQPRDFAGVHIARVIGDDRFEKRARAYFNKCLDGETQCYYYYLDTERHGRQLLECRMLRRYDTDDTTLGAVVVMRDLTDGFADPLRSAEENRV